MSTTHDGWGPEKLGFREAGVLSRADRGTNRLFKQIIFDWILLSQAAVPVRVKIITVQLEMPRATV